MKKVLQFAYGLESGGIEAFVTNLNNCKDVFEEPFDFLLYGSSDHVEFYEKKNIALDKVVCFYGTSSEINNWLQAMDVYLFPSLYEGLPVSGIEAQASGVPILASNTISPELEITDCINWMGLEQSSEEWAKRTIELLNMKHNRDTKEKIQIAGYDINNTAERLRSIYEID